jgi:hypothetical protein|tara:strand:- start:568 stop:1086 length:519 start_codon:yes stop_codon:yes gene_type:complete
MKRSDLNKFIKENIIETLSESSSSEEKRIALRAIKSIAKYRNVSEDEAKRDLINAIKELGSIKEELPSKEEVEDTTAAVQNLKKELDNLEEDDDVDDKDAVAQAKAARGKHKKLDIAVKAKKALETEMKSLARKYSAADDVEKEKIKDDLKAKTAKKKELESLVAKLEKDVV